jgi:hypothetical protein
MNTLDFKKPHKKKSGGIKSGEYGGQAISQNSKTFF